MKKNRFTAGALGLCIFLTGAVLLGLLCYAQASPISITLPANGTMVNPGQTLAVVVSVDSSVKNVMVAGEVPLGFGQDTGIAGQFAVAVPSEITPGPYVIGASGTDSAGNDVLSQITVDVERPDDPQELEVDDYVELTKLGDKLPLTVVGIFADGSRLLLENSTKVTYTSADPSIATVSSSGVITAAAQGETTVTASTAGGAVQAAAAVRVLLAKATAEDSIPPVTQTTAAPASNPAGWNNQNVTVSFSATDNDGGTGARMILANVTDASSGGVVLRGATGNLPVNYEGLTTIRYFSVDNAGNKEAPKTLVIKLDKTPPALAGIPQTCTLSGSHDPLLQVALISASDINSGVAAFSVSATSNQPQDADNPAIVISGTGLQPRAIQLRAEEGAVYTVTASATDVADNTASRSFTCTVVDN